MASIRDFASLERALTLPQSPRTDNEGHHLPRRSHDRHPVHRGSINTLASQTSNDTLRHRRMSRSNTVRAYHTPERPNWQPGAEPGIDTTQDAQNLEPHLEALRRRCDINVVDFSPDAMTMFPADNDTLAGTLTEKRPDDLPCRWISVNGLSWDVISTLGNKFGLHRLAIEDLINTRTRTKVDWYSDHAFAVMTLQKLVRLHSHEGFDTCDCANPPLNDEDEDDGMDDFAKPQANHHQKKRRRRWFSRSKGPVLPQHTDGPPRMDSFVPAHSSTSEDSPVQPIRTLHRYDGGQNPAHTAFMEKHSALAEEDLVVSVEQVAIFLMADNTVISFFEHSGSDVETPIVQRLNSPETMLRRSADASLLVQAIIDAIVDLAIPVKDAYNKARKDLQIDVLTNPSISTSKSLHIFTEEIDMLQNLFKPIVHLVNALRDHTTEPLGVGTNQFVASSRKGDKHNPAGRRPGYNRTHTAAITSTNVVISPLAHTYLGDVLDHCITIIQSLEQMDASANNLSSLIFNTVGANTNSFMQTMAWITAIFLPLTFLAGYFGMNFGHFTGVQHHSEAYFWVIAAPCEAAFVVIVFAMIGYSGFTNWLARFHLKKIRKRNKMAKRKRR